MYNVTQSNDPNIVNVTILVPIPQQQPGSSVSPVLDCPDSNVYSTIKTQPIKGNGSAARH